MKCPFRTEIEYMYEKLKEGDGYTYFNKGSIEKFPECYEKECPYYDSYYRKCNRLEECE